MKFQKRNDWKYEQWNNLIRLKLKTNETMNKSAKLTIYYSNFKKERKPDPP